MQSARTIDYTRIFSRVSNIFSQIICKTSHLRNIYLNIFRLVIHHCDKMFWIQEHILIFLPPPTDGFEGEILARSGDQLLVAALSSLFCTIFCTPPQHSQFTVELLNFDIDTIGELPLLIRPSICRKSLQTLVFTPLA